MRVTDDNNQELTKVRNQTERKVINMGHQSVQYIPRGVHTYKEAKWWHDQSTPIRGRSPEIRPLGRRRDVDTYWVREAEVGEGGTAVKVIDFMLYKTPVIRYYPDDTIELRTEGWSSVSTHQMFMYALGRSVEARSVRGSTVLTVDGKVQIMGGNDVVKLKAYKTSSNTSRLSIVDSKNVYGYRHNRKKWNEVNKQYKEFADYFKGFLSLRAAEEPSGTVTVTYTTDEAVEMFGDITNMGARQVVDMHQWMKAFHIYGPKSDYLKRAGELTHLMRSDERENKHTDFYKAALIITLVGSYIQVNHPHLTNVRRVSRNDVEARYEMLLKKWHAAEYLDKVELEPGKVPNMEYEEWVNYKEQSNG